MSQKLDYKLPKEATIYRVLSAEKILSTNSHKELLERVEKNIAGCSEKYEILYEPLIENFAKYVQTLRDYSNKNNYRMINIGLERAEYIANEFVKNHLHDYDYTYVFAVFSATLLLDIGRVDFLRKVHICNQEGAFISEWEPILGDSLYDIAKYYKIRDSVEEHVRMHNLVSPILATKIMPEIGLVSLRENQQLFAWWLAFLAKDESGKDAFSHEMKIYNKQFLEEHRKQMLADVEDEILLADKLEDSEKFWAWLKDELKDAKFNEKDGKVHKVAGGVYVDVEHYAKEFCEKYSSKAASYALLAKQFNSLGVAKLSGADLQFEKHFGNKGGYGSSFMFKSGAGDTLGSAINKKGVILASSQALVSGVTADNSKHVVNKAGDVKILQSNMASKTQSASNMVKNLDPNNSNNH